jgi:hypothetical protein
MHQGRGSKVRYVETLLEERGAAKEQCASLSTIKHVVIPDPCYVTTRSLKARGAKKYLGVIFIHHASAVDITTLGRYLHRVY